MKPISVGRMIYDRESQPDRLTGKLDVVRSTSRRKVAPELRLSLADIIDSSDSVGDGVQWWNKRKQGMCSGWCRFGGSKVAMMILDE
jgi:hypothetical protein